jgi:hypothetical protein
MSVAHVVKGNTISTNVVQRLRRNLSHIFIYKIVLDPLTPCYQLYAQTLYYIGSDLTNRLRMSEDLHIYVHYLTLDSYVRLVELAGTHQ